MRKLVLLGVWDNKWTMEALQLVKEVVSFRPIYKCDKQVYFKPIGEGVHPINSNVLKQKVPTLVMCDGDQDLSEELVTDDLTVVLGVGLEEIEKWYDIQMVDNTDGL